jgi:hypothetical protein
MNALPYWMKITATGLTMVLLYGAAICIPWLLIKGLELPIVVSLMGSGIAFATGVLALAKDSVTAWVNAPILCIEFLPKDRRDCHRTHVSNADTGSHLWDTYYFRMRIRNRGRSAAENVEVTIDEVNTLINGKPHLSEEHQPGWLFWSYWRDRRPAMRIPSGSYRYCDLGHIDEPIVSPLGNRKLFLFDLVHPPNTGGWYLSPGKYRIRVSAVGSNARPCSRYLTIEWNGTWHDSIDELFAKSLTIEEVR